MEAKKTRQEEMAVHLLNENGTTRKVRHYFRITLDWYDRDISYDSVMQGISNALKGFCEVEVVSINEDDTCPTNPFFRP